MKIDLPKDIDKRVLKLIAEKICNIYSSEKIQSVFGRTTRIADPVRFLTAKFVDKVSEADLEGYINYENLWTLVEKFLDPLNLNGDYEECLELEEQIDYLLKNYTDFSIPERGGKVMNKKQAAEYYKDFFPSQEEHEEEEQKEIDSIKNNLEELEIIELLHREYGNLLFTFCTKPYPTSELNISYLELRDVLLKKIKSLKLHIYSFGLEIPFKVDLYTAEDEWNQSDSSNIFSGLIKWSKVRPKVMATHSKIEELLRIGRSVNLEESENQIIDKSQLNRSNHLNKFENKKIESGIREFLSGINKLTFSLDTGTVQLNKTRAAFKPDTQHFILFSHLTEKYNYPVEYKTLLLSIKKPTNKNTRYELGLIVNDMKHKLEILPKNKSSNPDIFHTISKVGYKIFLPK